MRLLPCTCGGVPVKSGNARIRCSNCRHETDLHLIMSAAAREWNCWQRAQPGADTRGAFARMLDSIAWRLGF